MPLYTYSCINCDSDEERLASISARDEQKCAGCGYSLIRSIDRPGMVWSPTRNGGYSL
jgi:putative FmdB family regulatory protein